MDGVLARFDKAENGLQRYASEKGFFAGLELTEFAKRIAKIKNTNRFYILTSSPNEIADNDKRNWLRINLSNIKQENVLIVRDGKDKAKFADAYSILIDDYTDNLLEFEKRGGKVIKAKSFLTNKKGVSKSKGYKGVTVF